MGFLGIESAGSELCTWPFLLSPAAAGRSYGEPRLRPAQTLSSVLPSVSAFASSRTSIAHGLFSFPLLGDVPTVCALQAGSWHPSLLHVRRARALPAAQRVSGLPGRRLSPGGRRGDQDVSQLLQLLTGFEHVCVGSGMSTECSQWEAKGETASLGSNSCTAIGHASLFCLLWVLLALSFS